NGTLQQLQRLDITDAEINTISENIERQFNLNQRTLGFTGCVNLFQSHITGANYFDKLKPNSYTVSNSETVRSFGNVVDPTNAFSKVEILRNHYAHVAQPTTFLCVYYASEVVVVPINVDFSERCHFESLLVTFVSSFARQRVRSGAAIAVNTGLGRDPVLYYKGLFYCHADGSRLNS